MNKSIYDEALQELKDFEIILYYDISKIKMALKQAQKQEKLLGLYKELVYHWEHRFDNTNSIGERERLWKQIKELEEEE